MGQSERASGLATALLWVQGIYLLITGVWRLVSIRTFQWVGDRADLSGGRGDSRLC
jgi:hypothetical protein